MISTTVMFMTATWVVMLVAYFLSRFRPLHISIMGALIIIDFLFPVYLIATRDWYKTLIVDGEILSFALWFHLMVVITLYVLYVVQIQAGRRLKAGDQSARSEHRGQGMAILVTRALVISTGALLVEPSALDDD